MRRKHLESALSSVQREFPSPDVTLEQYPTSPMLTASVILTALEKGDLGPGRSACDLGCGTGMLALGCALVECDHVVGVECDAEALQIAAENVADMDLEDVISLVLAKVKPSSSGDRPQPSKGRRQQSHRNGSRKGRGRGGNAGRVSSESNLATTMDDDDDDGLPLRSDCVDTVLTNPPFGTKNNAGMDIRFLKASTRLARRAVYSFHKSSTRDFLLRTVRGWGMQIEVVAEMRFDLPQTYKFHKEKSVDIAVDLIRVLLPGAKGVAEAACGGDGGREETSKDECQSD